MGDVRAALKYARLARDRYPYRTTCGTGLREYLQRVNQRVADLELAVVGFDTPLDDPTNYLGPETPNLPVKRVFSDGSVFPLPQF